MIAQIYIACSGIGHIRRGFENYCEDLFHLMTNEKVGNFTLLKGKGYRTENEIVLPHLRRTSRAAKVMSMVLGKSTYYIQGLTFGLACVFYLFRKNDFVVYLGEPVLYAVLNRFRQYSKKRFTMIFFTGGQSVPGNFNSRDLLHHVTNVLTSDAASPTKQFVIPHFVSGSKTLRLCLDEVKTLRSELNVPLDRVVVLSVGAIDRSVKRMNYLIEEFNKLDQEQYFLIILGEIENETADVMRLASEKLQSGNYKIDNVSRKDLDKFYQVSDLFVLCSLREGFGLAYVEALQHGLPVIAHDFQVSRFVLEDQGFFLDLSSHGVLAKFIMNFNFQVDKDNREVRQEFVVAHYSWESLKRNYIAMFKAAISSRESNSQGIR